MLSLFKKSPKELGGVERRQYIPVYFDDVDKRLDKIKNLFDEEISGRKNPCSAFYIFPSKFHIENMLNEQYIPWQTSLDYQKLHVSKKELYILNCKKLNIIKEIVQKNIERTKCHPELFASSGLKEWQDMLSQVNVSITQHELKNKPIECTIL